MTLKVNVKPLAAKNLIGTLCVTVKWQRTVVVLQEQEHFAGKTDYDDQLSWPWETLESHWGHNTGFRELESKCFHQVVGLWGHQQHAQLPDSRRTSGSATLLPRDKPGYRVQAIILDPQMHYKQCFGLSWRRCQSL